MNEQSQQPAWFFWFFADLHCANDDPVSCYLVGRLHHPSTSRPIFTYGSVAYRLLTALVIVPVWLDRIDAGAAARAAQRDRVCSCSVGLSIIMVSTVRLDSPVSTETFNFMWSGYGCCRCSSRTGSPRHGALGNGCVCSAFIYTHSCLLDRRLSSRQFHLTRLQQQVGTGCQSALYRRIVSVRRTCLSFLSLCSAW